MNIIYFLLAIFSIFQTIYCTENNKVKTASVNTKENEEERNEEDLNKSFMYALKVYDYYDYEIIDHVSKANKQLFNNSFDNDFILIRMEIYRENEFQDKIFKNGSIHSKMLLKKLEHKANDFKGRFKTEKDQLPESIDATNKVQAGMSIEDKTNFSIENSNCKSSIVYTSVVEIIKNLQKKIEEIFMAEINCRKLTYMKKNGNFCSSRFTNLYIFCDIALDKISHQNLLKHLKTLENQKNSNDTKFCYYIIFYFENFKYRKNKIKNILKTIIQPTSNICGFLPSYSINIISQEKIHFFNKISTKDIETKFQKSKFN
ncbi:hypothetical protein GVAV_001234 [Gurleya vavrai]